MTIEYIPSALRLPVVLGGTPLIGEIPEWPPRNIAARDRLMAAYDSGNWWRGSGSEVGLLERRFAQMHGVNHAISCASGTHSLEIALRASSIGPGDEVIVPALTFAATGMAVLSVGAVPVAVDVSPFDWCLDPAGVAAVIGPRTKAIIPVHFAGHPCDPLAIMQLARRHDIVIIEDAAHAHGASTIHGTVGSIGLFAAFSFQQFKILSAGEGGMLLSTDDALAERARLIACCGRPEDAQGYEHLVAATTSRLTELQAAILQEQLDRLEERANKRVENAKLLAAHLHDVPSLRLQQTRSYVRKHAHYLVACQLDPEIFGSVCLAKVVRALRAEGLPAQVMYPSLHQLPPFKRFHSETPVSDALSKWGFWLHHQILLGDSRLIEVVAEAMKRVLENANVLANVV